ncbi:hypothetical protein G9A89_005289 [Geosiphon pyriformis]|nr:hypothetical protein G9A89_005289 [Geosiphon pyriformis]
MCFTSQDVNYLIYRYLEESDFKHTKFNLKNESALRIEDYNAADVPPGRLISLLQKALQYMELEKHANIEGTQNKCSAPFSIVGPTHQCEISHLLIEDKPKNSKKHKRDESPQISNKKDRREERRGPKDQQNRESRAKDTELGQDQFQINNGDNLDIDRVPLAEIPSTAASGNESGLTPAHQVSEDLTVLRGHEMEVYACVWNPVNNLLATGSRDSTIRIWNTDQLKGPEHKRSVVCRIDTRETEVPVTFLDWNHLGTQLAAGYYDGSGRVWTQNGELLYETQLHTAAVLAFKWGKKEKYLLSCSLDGGVILWDPQLNTKKVFNNHTVAVMDVAWKNKTTFATCSKDSKIVICDIEKEQPIMCYVGHTNEVNAIKWESNGNYLASCSDDCTAKIWSEKPNAIKTFRHDGKVFSIKWCPNPRRNTRILATVSFDLSVRLWEVNSGTCQHHFRFQDTVHSVAFTPDGTYIATACFDHTSKIFSVKTGALKKTTHNGGALFELDLKTAQSTERERKYKMASAVSNGTITLLDFPQ